MPKKMYFAAIMYEKNKGQKKFGKPREKKFFSFDPSKGVFTEGKKTYPSFPKKKFEFYLTEHKNILLKEVEDDFYYFVNRKFSNYIDRFKVISQEDFTNFAEAKLLCRRLPIVQTLFCSYPEAVNAAILILLKNKLPFEQTAVFYHMQKKKEKEKNITLAIEISEVYALS